MRAIQDGQIIDAAEARIPATDEGLLFGDGVFEVIRLYGGQPFALTEHCERMARSAANLRLPIDLDLFQEEVAKLLKTARPGDAVLRLIATRGGRRYAILEELKSFPENFALVTLEYSPPLVLDGVKSLSYGANMLASRIAQERGGDEALLVNPDGRVLEAPTSSFFYGMGTEELFTPPLSDHILDSITRRHIIAAAGATERPLEIGELSELSEAFIASTVREVIPVRSIDEQVYTASGKLTKNAKAEVLRRIYSLL